MINLIFRHAIVTKAISDNDWIQQVYFKHCIQHFLVIYIHIQLFFK